MAWNVSGKPWRQKAYQQGLQPLSQQEDQVQHLIANQPGESGLASVIDPVRCDVNWILNYLAEKFDQGLEYSNYCRLYICNFGLSHRY